MRVAQDVPPKQSRQEVLAGVLTEVGYAFPYGHMVEVLEIALKRWESSEPEAIYSVTGLTYEEMACLSEAVTLLAQGRYQFRAAPPGPFSSPAHSLSAAFRAALEPDCPGDVCTGDPGKP